VIAVCTLTALSIVEVVAHQELPTPSTVAAERIARSPNNAELIHKPMISAASARMQPEEAFEAYQCQAASQASSLQEYSVLSLINVKLVDISQGGVFELRRHYVAPQSLESLPPFALQVTLS